MCPLYSSHTLKTSLINEKNIYCDRACMYFYENSLKFTSVPGKYLTHSLQAQHFPKVTVLVHSNLPQPGRVPLHELLMPPHIPALP